MKGPAIDAGKHPALGPHDEEFIRTGTAKADTESVISSAPSHAEQEKKDAANPIDDSKFAPTRIFYIVKHNLFSKEVRIIDATAKTHVRYTGGDISDELRDAVRAVSEDASHAANPAYQLKRAHWFSSTCTMTSSTSPGTELASWKHSSASFGKADINFPANSKHGSHGFIMENVKWYRRTNEWVQDSVTYSWRCNSKTKANRMELLKQVGPKQYVVARYAQRWGSWVTGGVLLVDGNQTDEAVAVLTACVMLRRMQQRAAERMSMNGGGGGGGGE
ncbi:hypothetical protein BDV95DRAFT_612633 [Massariosphaeria phaeospora]|uniref:Uncharacterized protein n=1 Tax=Massariosphaeria phaeospora TaxID=100035 RepID=A0A7C8I6B6_9PLEO|nr:hypothetical protein BDV95DRAFT_612633 [Massariosphaeria phaeospora]